MKLVMKEASKKSTMKPLTLPGCEAGSRGNKSKKDKKNFHLVGILNPDENTTKCKGWVFIIASKELPKGMEGVKMATKEESLGQLRFSRDQWRELFSNFSPREMTSPQECLYAGKYIIYDWNGKPLKLLSSSNGNGNSSDNPDFTAATKEHVEFLRNQKWKFLVDELDDYCMFLLPVDSKTGAIIQGVNLEGNITSGPPTRRGAGERIIAEHERQRWKAEHLPLPIGLFITREQWKSLVGCVATLQENLFGGGRVGNGKRKAGFWIKKRKQGGEATSNVNNKSGFLKWIKNKKGGSGGGEGGKRSWTRGSVVDIEENEVEEEDDVEVEQEEIKLIKGKKVGGDHEKKKFLRRKMRICSSSSITGQKQRNGKGTERTVSKARRINFLERKGQGFGKKSKKDEEGTTTEEIEEKDTQLIRIELKADLMVQESTVQYTSGDLLTLKLTMYEFPKRNEDGAHQQVEIDFVQNFMCETDTLDKCRCRRITKLLKRTIVPELEWEKGIHISGQQFALCWIPYRIPGFVGAETGKKEESGRWMEGEEKAFSADSLDNKFKVTGSQYELQIRFYQKDEEYSHYVLSACSCFPLNVLMKTTEMMMGRDMNSSMASGGDDDLQDGEGAVEEEEEIMERVVVVAGGRNMIMIKSLSATEFDV